MSLLGTANKTNQIIHDLINAGDAIENRSDPLQAVEYVNAIFDAASRLMPPAVGYVVRDIVDTWATDLRTTGEKIREANQRIQAAAEADGVPGFAPANQTTPPPGMIWQPTITVSPDGKEFSQGPSQLVPEGTNISTNKYYDIDGNRIYPPDGGWANPTDPSKPWNDSPPSNDSQSGSAISDAIINAPDPMVTITRLIPYRDPLILDLDGDGIEITPLSSGVMFDTNGDTIKTATAWAGADDGILVWDRNGNGIIDSGAEIFGDEMLLSNGRKAGNGFDALAQLNSHPDFNFDAQDDFYSEVRVWRDLNQDGISQANELQTLAASGIASIKLNSSVSGTVYGDSVMVLESTFTRTDGSSGQAGSFLFAQNDTIREYVPVIVGEAAMALPDINGSGWVRDLREAATLNPDLVALVNQAKNAPTRAEFESSVEQLMREWGDGSEYLSAGREALAAGYGLILSGPLDDQERGWMDVGIKASEVDRNAFRATLLADDLSKFDAMRERMVGGLEKLYAYEAFTGHTFLDWGQVYNDAHYVPRLGLPVYEEGVRLVPVEVVVPLSQLIAEQRNGVLLYDDYIRVTIPPMPNGVSYFENLWDRLVDDATNNLMPSLRLSQYLDLVDLNISATGVTVGFDGLNASVSEAMAANTQEGAALFLDLNRIYGERFNQMGWDGTEQLRSLKQRWGTEQDVRNAFVATGINSLSAVATSGTSGDDAFVGNASGNVFSAGDGNDLIDGQAGNDTLYGGGGMDALFGGDGNDNLNGDNGDDILDGGSGNDTLNGDVGNDTYLLALGSGVDTITDYDTTTGNSDVVQFSNVASTALTALERSGNHLVIKYGTADQLTVNEYFNSGYPGYKIEQFKFSDGVTWDEAAIKARVITNGTVGNDSISGYNDGTNRIFGLDGNDYLYGGALADWIEGGNGNDSLNGNAGNDTLLGGAGTDILNGGAGNDILNGGADNDTLNGDVGNDTYLLALGSGVDTITDYDTTAGNSDVVQFSNVASTALTALERSGNHLVIKYGTADQLTVNEYFNSGYPGYKIEQFKFSDGVTWDEAAIKARVITNGTVNGDSISGYNDGTNRIFGLDGNDYLYGGALADQIDGGIGNDSLNGNAGNDTLLGGAGMDTLNGGAGNDILNGGADNDTLNGGTGNDTYLFGRGSSADVINDYDTTLGNSDRLSVGGGVDINQLWFRRMGSDLEVSIIGTSDRSTISNWYSGNAYRIEEFTTADGKTLLDTRVENLVSAMASFAPPAAGQTSLSPEYDAALTPVITANWQ